MTTDPIRSRASRITIVTVATVLAVAVVAIYAPVRHADFLSLDDTIYVNENPYVRGGFTADGLRHALYGTRGTLWMPLTFISHMADVSLFGLDPTGHHLVNIGFHAANAILLLLLLVRATGAVAPSVAVAALFALHPLRVESVAWIAERKDVLSAFLGLLALHAWVSHARRPGLGRYLVALGLVLLALLSKPMLVTLPVLMLLMDLWPLRRLEGDAGVPRTTLRELVMEKIPLLLVAGGTAGFTLMTVREGAALVTLSDFPFTARVAHATVSYVWYVWKMLWPADLGMFYPYPTWAAWQVAGAAVTLAAAAVLAISAWRRARWISVGLAWWAVALFPVIGLFQAGSQGMADRFTYLPSIGLLVAVAWTVDALVRAPRARFVLGAGVAAASAALAVASARQVGWWRDGRTLYEHTLAVTTGNWIIHAEVGNQLLSEGQPERAYVHFEESFRLEPRFAKAAFGLGLAAKALGRPDEAEAHYRNTLRVDPTYVKAHTNLGIMLFERQATDEGLYHLSEAMRMEPTSPDIVRNLRFALGQLGMADVEGYVNGLRSWTVAVSVDRERPGGASYNAGLMQQLLGQRVDAVRGCLGGTTPAPFDLYIAVGADGAVENVTPLPSTTVARCLGDELRAARVSAPPFAPFHAQMTMRFDG
jgi:tetratricopeptide (TPR) repeat protein